MSDFKNMNASLLENCVNSLCEDLFNDTVEQEDYTVGLNLVFNKMVYHSQKQTIAMGKIVQMISELSSVIAGIKTVVLDDINKNDN